jgi:hypothetical protein
VFKGSDYVPQLHLLKNSEDLLSTVKMRQSDSVSPALSDFHLASGKIGTKHRYPLCKHEMEKQFN